MEGGDFCHDTGADQKRLDELEKQVALLRVKVDGDQASSKPWWEAEVGRFKNDPLFEKAVASGRKWRESFRPEKSVPE